MFLDCFDDLLYLFGRFEAAREVQMNQIQVLSYELLQRTQFDVLVHGGHRHLQYSKSCVLLQSFEEDVILVTEKLVPTDVKCFKWTRLFQYLAES